MTEKEEKYLDKQWHVAMKKYLDACKVEDKDEMIAWSKVLDEYEDKLKKQREREGYTIRNDAPWWYGWRNQ